jgi:peptidoglycan-associated lipoprotein
MNKFILSAALVLFAGFLSGCSTTNSDVSGSGKIAADAAEKDAMAKEEAAKAAAARDAAARDVAARELAAKEAAARDAAAKMAPPPVATVDPLNDPNSILAKRSVFYPLDVAVVQADDSAIVEAHAKYLSEHPDKKVRLEGNCDERGSDEYNLALGQRRADGVKKLLEAGGVRENQISTISYGEEKPKATGHDEASWSQNRRTDLNYNAN